MVIKVIEDVDVIKINVIDLDKTLVPFDSFRYLIKQEIKAGNLKVLFYTLLRVLRVINASKYKKIISKSLSIDDNSEIIRKISDHLYNSIDDQVLKTVNENTDKETLNIICSASPNSYVNRLAEKLEWIGHGSKEYNGLFINLHGKNKLNFLRNTYPPGKYLYNFSISDSRKDIELLKLFNNYIIIGSH